MEQETMGTVTAVSRQWWLKINRRPLRLHALAGAAFPHVVKITYTAEGRDRTCRKWVPAGTPPPCVGSQVRLRYDTDRPSSARAEL